MSCGHLKPIEAKLRSAVRNHFGYDHIRVIGADECIPTDVKTLPYPGFPTDMQAQFMALLSIARNKRHH